MQSDGMPSSAEIQDALRTLSRAIAPYVAEALDDKQLAAERPSARVYDEESIRELVGGLAPEVIRGGRELFHLLSTASETDSHALADRTGLPPTALSGRLLRPLRQRARELSLPDPWVELGRKAGRTVWGDRDGTAHRLYAAFDAAGDKLAQPGRSGSRSRLGPEAPRVPVPVAAFPFRPEYAESLHRPVDGSSSCLRGFGPGDRAVIYQVHHDQGIVALFDAAGKAYPDPDWGWKADGHYTPVPNPISREMLLADPVLAPIFDKLQGRRWLPDDQVQHALTALLQDHGRFPNDRLPPLPPEATTRASTHNDRRRRRSNG